MKRNNPDTSLAAYDSIDEKMLSEHHRMIAKALVALRSASAEQIAEYIGLTHVQANRRVSEMERMQLIWRPGGKVPTKTGRSAFVWQLREEAAPLIAPVEKVLKGPSISHFSKKIQQITQSSLF